MRKHEYEEIEDEKAYLYKSYMCIHCKKMNTLCDWQIRALPRDIAKCPSKEAKKVNWLESWFNTFNCLK